jgi:hypothetical protein
MGLLKGLHKKHDKTRTTVRSCASNHTATHRSAQ